jgi:hypothetical protein
MGGKSHDESRPVVWSRNDPGFVLRGPHPGEWPCPHPHRNTALGSQRPLSSQLDQRTHFERIGGVQFHPNARFRYIARQTGNGGCAKKMPAITAHHAGSVAQVRASDPN